MISSALSAVISGPWKKSAAAMTRVAGFADDGDRCLAGDDDARHLGRRIGMGKAAAGGAAIADLIMRDVSDGRHQKRMRLVQPRVLEDVGPAHHGAERHPALPDLDLPQLRKLAQIDQERRCRDPKGQHRHETLAAGERLGFAVMRGEECDSLGNAGRAGVFERREFHVAATSLLHPLRTAEMDMKR